MRATHDRGAGVVEAAFVIPLFMFLILGMIDLGFGAFQSSQATSAARDGARYGILHKLDEAGVEAEVRARLIKVAGLATDVECLDGLSGTTVIPCAQAARGEDRIRVAVEWPYDAPTPLGEAFGGDRIRGVATMVIASESSTITTVSTTTTSTSTTTTTAPGGTTTTTVPGSTSTTTSTTSTTVPGQCVVTGMTFDPAPLQVAKNGKHLTKPTTFTVTTNGAATCTSLRIVYPAVEKGSGAPASALLDAQLGNHVSTNEYDWTPGDNRLFQVRTSGGTVIGAFELDIDEE